MGPVKSAGGKVEGYCEECVKIKENLDVVCMCKKVFYCSNECCYYDKSYHAKICDLAYDSEDDDDICNLSVKKEDQKVKLGLKNIGNTCYMNSALQCMAASENFSNFYASNEFKKYLKEEDS